MLRVVCGLMLLLGGAALRSVPLRTTAPQIATRRSFVFLGGGAAAALGLALPVGAEVPVDPFNSMCFGFGCAGVQKTDKAFGSAKPEGESIDWPAFLKLVDDKKVQSVEFDDVNMTKAWAILKGLDGEPQRIRIGEGYPVESGDSWCVLHSHNLKTVSGPRPCSSPAYSRMHA